MNRGRFDGTDIVALLQVLPLEKGRHRAAIISNFQSQSGLAGRCLITLVDQSSPGCPVVLGNHLVLIDLLEEL